VIDQPTRTSLAIAATLSAAILLTLTAPRPRTVLAADKPADKPAAVFGWDPQAAARYLDSREVWWQQWDRTQKDHGTYCISCHTQLPYGLARPILRQQLSEPAPSGAERAMLDSIEKRVRLWDEVEPFYKNDKNGVGQAVGARNAESVLNAIILASYDRRQGHTSETTLLAFRNAWALQSKTGPTAGAWVWQNFHYTPWESPESEYYFAAQMAIANGKLAAPIPRDNPMQSSLVNQPEFRNQGRANPADLALLTGYLRTHYEAQPLVNKLAAFWAERHLPGLLTPQQDRKLIADLDRLQHNDGGWSLTDLGSWQRMDNTPLETRSDGYATGLIVLALEQHFTPNRARRMPQVARAIAWLIANQDKTTGAWPAWSLNKNRDPDSNAGPFMTDAATAYAVMALEARH
jgi:hypothetical protein